jgi:hypothetical protein
LAVLRAVSATGPIRLFATLIQGNCRYLKALESLVLSYACMLVLHFQPIFERIALKVHFAR